MFKHMSYVYLPRIPCDMNSVRYDKCSRLRQVIQRIEENIQNVVIQLFHENHSKYSIDIESSFINIQNMFHQKLNIDTWNISIDYIE